MSRSPIALIECTVDRTHRWLDWLKQALRGRGRHMAEPERCVWVVEREAISLREHAPMYPRRIYADGTTRDRTLLKVRFQDAPPAQSPEEALDDFERGLSMATREFFNLVWRHTAAGELRDVKSILPGGSLRVRTESEGSHGA